MACEKLNGCTDIVRILIQSGANVNFKNRVSDALVSFISLSLKFYCMQDGDTALFMACRSGFTAIVDILLHNGANVNIENTVNFKAI